MSLLKARGLIRRLLLSLLKAYGLIRRLLYEPVQSSRPYPPIALSPK
jgi:hypothetical protein